MKNKYHAVADVLLKLEMEMRANSLWTAITPSSVGLHSIQPFCVDTLFFHEWLQFIYIPQLKNIVEEGRQLPSSCDIVPMAEESFKLTNKRTDTILELLVECEQILMT
ncbi:MAG: hypothetical protein A6F71_05610 [Cycloclasticus sp. symbiont of Poecilosclerida sp. M]|nr:MAG: hypothetical protein A6F71_05610 [Cycloclasticus sp. symbiont of Poecilosclerida sp. M]